MATLTKPRGRKPVAHGPLSFGWGSMCGGPASFRVTLHDCGSPHSVEIDQMEAVQLAAFILTTGSDSTGPAYLAEAVAEAVDKRGKPDYHGELGAAAQVAAVFARVFAEELKKESF